MDKKKILCAKRKTGRFLLISSLLIILCISAIGIAGCGKQEEHTHAFTEQNVKQTYLASSATCTQAAKYYYSCTCGEKGTETFAYGGLGRHTYSEKWMYNATHHWHTATCGHEEKRDYAPHVTDESGFCAICDQPINSTEGIVYIISSGGSYAEVIDYVGTSKQIKIAGTYNSLPVKTICREAFLNKEISSVTIPDSVTSIGNYAFYGCSGLTSITIPDRKTCSWGIRTIIENQKINVGISSSS